MMLSLRVVQIVGHINPAFGAGSLSGHENTIFFSLSIVHLVHLEGYINPASGAGSSYVHFFSS